MCGRYASTRSAADLAELFGVEDLTDSDLVPSYNIAPTDPAPIVLANAGAAALRVARWGFLPPWARDASGAARMINARAETVATSRAFGEAFARRRCLVAADGWYEWRVLGTGRTRRRQAYFMTRPEPVVFGGVWSTWNVERRLTFSIITIPAIGALSAVHDRMPLIVEKSRWESWLEGADATPLLTPREAEFSARFEIRPVSAAVGDVRKDGPELVQPLATERAELSTVEQAPTLF